MDRRCSSSSARWPFRGCRRCNGFASEWLTFQALLFGFRGSPDPLVHFLFPVGGALLALTTALAAACFVKAFGITLPGVAAEPGGGGSA